MTLFNGADNWPKILETLAAGRLDPSNVWVFALFVSISIAYGLGQLVAPFGKIAQRVTEFIAVAVLPKKEDPSKEREAPKKKEHL